MVLYAGGTKTILAHTQKVSQSVSKTLGMVAGYVAFMKASYLIVLTAITSLYLHSPLKGAEKTSDGLQKVHDITRSNALITFGITSALFITLLQFLHPLTTTRWNRVLIWAEFRSKYSVEAFTGFVLAGVYVFGTLLGGFMKYLGFYVNMEELLLSFSSLIVFAICLFFMVLVEEYILREVLEKKVSSTHPVLAVVLSSLVFLAFKQLQFEITFLESVNLLLLNVILSRVAVAKTHMGSAWFAFSFFLVNHIVLGLPFLGQEMPGILLMRLESRGGFNSLISGGVRGPMASFVTIVLFSIYCFLPILKNRDSFRRKFS